MEPGVTVWGRASSWVGTAQARIYRPGIRSIDANLASVREAAFSTTTRG